MHHVTDKLKIKSKEKQQFGSHWCSHKLGNTEGKYDAGKQTCVIPIEEQRNARAIKW